MKNIFFEKSPLIVENLILLEGRTRAGKLFLGKIISNLENTQYFQIPTVLENVPMILKAGGMTEDAAAGLIKLIIDEGFYYQGLGRNTNMRFDDASSIYNSLEFDEYLKRSLTPMSKELKMKILIDGKKRSVLYIIPDSFCLIDIFFKTYPDLKLIKEIRHPIDLIYSCYINGFGNRHEDDPIGFHMVLETSKAAIPWYALDWKDDYLNLADIDRVIKSVKYLNDLEIKVFHELSEKQKGQVLVLRYENIVEKTNEMIELMSKFFGKKPLEGMQTVLARERVPRKLPLEERKKKDAILKKNASKEYYKIVTDLVDSYHENKFNEVDT